MYISVVIKTSHEVAMLHTFCVYTEIAEGMANGFARKESQPKLEGTDKTSPRTTTV